MHVSSQGHCGFPSFPVVDWFCLFVDLRVLPFPLEDCSVFGNFFITLISKYRSSFSGENETMQTCGWITWTITNPIENLEWYEGPPERILAIYLITRPLSPRGLRSQSRLLQRNTKYFQMLFYVNLENIFKRTTANQILITGDITWESDVRIKTN